MIFVDGFDSTEVSKKGRALVRVYQHKFVSVQLHTTLQKCEDLVDNARLWLVLTEIIRDIQLIYGGEG